MQLMINIAISTSIYLLSALSFKMLYQISKVFYITHAATILIASYFFYYCVSLMDSNIILASIISLFLSTLISSTISLLIVLSLKNKGATSLVYLIATLGAYIVIENIVSLLFGSGNKQINIIDISSLEFFSGYISVPQILLIIFSILTLFSLIIFTNKSSIGQKILAISENEPLCILYGINIKKYFSWSFIIGAFIASLLGILISLDTGLKPTMGFNILLYGVITLIISGIGKQWSLIFGALILSALQNLGAFYFDSKWIDALAYAILILFLIWKPYGLSGYKLKKLNV